MTPYKTEFTHFIKMNVRIVILTAVLAVKSCACFNVDSLNKLTVKIDEGVSSRHCNRTLSNLQVSVT